VIKYAHQYLRSASAIIDVYDGSLPLAIFLKQYFKQQKKFGSKDRRYIAQACYCYFRLARAIVSDSVEEKIKASLFLCYTDINEWGAVFPEEWKSGWNDDIKTKLGFVTKKFPGTKEQNIFPWMNELSGGIDNEKFLYSHFVQPDLFLRIRPGKEKYVLQKLNEQQITYKQIKPDCLALPNSSKIDAILEIDKEVVIQDYSSQRIKEFFQFKIQNSKFKIELWDCCAASGGKSILAYDTLQNIELTVSDVRPAILQNLKERFEKVGIKNYQSFVADLTNPTLKIQHSKFNIILCDAPCSGSGTWGRTPEQLCFFTDGKINEYASLQKKIVNNVLGKVADGGYFLYITCSVFKKENEEMVSFIQQQSGFELVKMELLKGYEVKADSMFAALFSRK